jgi:hypothetical protein
VGDVVKNVAAGAEPEGDTVGITGLVPLRVIACPPLMQRLVPGLVRIHIRFAPGDGLQPGKPIIYRIFGGEAGLQIENNGRIVQLRDPRLPLELPYRPRTFPEPPPRGQLVVDLGFWHRKGTGWGAEDVQWRQPVVWDKSGTTHVDMEVVANVP